MKKSNVILLIAICLLNSIVVFGQATRPTIMVVPSDQWCDKQGYVLSFDNQGQTETIPDYMTALQKDPELSKVINTIGDMMSERGFPLQLLEGSLKELKEQAAEDAMLSSKSGAGIAESPIDKLYKVAKADIIMKLDWTVNQNGPKRSITFDLLGEDAYTHEQAAHGGGTGSQSSTPELAVLLQEAVLSNIDNFNSQLQDYFDDMAQYGRKIIVQIKVFDDFADGDGLETEFDDKQLNEIIEDWMADNTVEGRYNLSTSTDNQMIFKAVRIPLFEERDGKARAVQANGWVRKLQKYLKDKYQIQAKLMMKGLGQAQLVIGGK